MTDANRSDVTEKELLDFLGAYANRAVPGSGVARLIGRILPQSLRPVTRVVATNAISIKERMSAKKMAERDPLKLNLGCGALPLEGWVNVDLVGLPVDLAWNLTTPLPFDDGTVDAIFHEHVLEHLDAYTGFHFLKDCHRMLKPDGVMRIVLPDAGRYISSYSDPEHEFLRSWRGIRFTAMMSIQEEVYNFGHRALYDYETLELFCRVIGFETIESKEFGESRLSPCPDSEMRIINSFYTELVKSRRLDA